MKNKIAEKPSISPSRLESYTRCGEAYRRRYLEKEIIPPGVAMAKGTAIHKAQELNFVQKIETHEDIPLSQAVDKAVATFEGIQKNETLWFSKEDEDKGKDIVIDEAKDQVATGTAAMMTGIAPRYQPKEVEVKQTIELPMASHNMLGIIDLITDDEKIVDLKTGAKSRSQADVDADTQLSFYDLTYLAKYKKPPKALVIEQVVFLKAGAKINTIETHRDNKSRQVLVNRINTMLNGLKAGVFMPASAGAWWCSARFCGYHSTCPYVRKNNV